MTELEFMKSINDIDDDLLSAADRVPAGKPMTYHWVRYASIAAMICAVVGLGFFTVRSLTHQTVSSNTIISFALEGTYYDVADLQDYVTYGLLSEDSLTRSTVDIKPLTKEDLGEQIGTIRGSDNKELRVYHHAKYPDNEDICVIALSNGEYQVYVKREP